MSKFAGEKLEIEVAGGLARLHFESHLKTGPQGSDTWPGIGFDISFQVAPVKDIEGRHYAATGVISRTDALKLKNLIIRFLNEFDHARNLVHR